MRFAEQLWSAIIAIISFSSGIALIVQFPEHFRQDTVWTSYPILRMPYVLKLYYLAENGYWLATLTYLFLEKRRKDFAMMVIHHFSTIFLVAGSYYINFTSAGVIIHATMDLVDIFLPLAKIFNYIGLQLYCDISFVAMAIAWIFSRHYVFLRILHDVIFVSSRLANPNWDPANGLYYTRNTRHLFLFFLIALEVLFFIWLYSILKIIYRVVMGNQLEDIRSDDEE
ncbi:Sphingosine N-acyltransferase lag1 [Zancudomyces culisetae]|uniref:Sphingosine N-acyltransferase lag1 n=1 Tax=Zancudomyces culisetae TaxID=1213189 RepID=A0A1R1PVW7_ZANCU|nr:Sphingosine N-acyltransferase lag1 [Zancudomyces culisetae]|eukprot:OMH85079.1 Sphingosine N-acyltransferase lag1 [Zancudomyces culisetae]